ncbi:MAG: class I SAM-dependent methyltransferase [Candidatus Omnitrophica bacterium]|nr:class I SAM-dependent methyltransferase [Candidatus Omnitrophota bacterium]MDD5574891.1 class I SAM-dependent methyltransferase [Candidatus Omnitrophota bacterium]
MNSFFDKHCKRYDAWYDRHPFAFLSEIEAIRKVLPPSGKGLEIGVGTGRFAAALGITAGIDPSRKMLELARKRGVDARFGRGDEVPFCRGVFDYILIVITLCFVKNPQKVLEEARRVLTKTGTIVIGIVDKESFLGEFYRSKKSIFYRQAKFLSVSKVTAMLKDAGFASFVYYQTISVLPDCISSVEKPKKGFGKGGFVVIGARKR